MRINSKNFFDRKLDNVPPHFTKFSKWFSDYELLNPSKSTNHICQNVHFKTSTDMATEIKAVLDGERKFADTDFLFQNNYQKKHQIWNERQATLEHFL